jgi:signal transduction histidine kinase
MRNWLASFRVRLFLLVLIALLPILGLMLYTDQEQRRVTVNDVEQNALRLARLAAANQERLIEGTRQLLIVLSQLPAVRNQDAAACSQFMADLWKQYPLYEDMGIADLDGDMFCTAVPSDVRLNVADRPWFKRTIQTRDFVAGDYIIARITGRPVLSTAYPILDEEGQVQAVAFAGIDLEWLDAFVAQAQLPAGSTLTLVDDSGIILTRFPSPEAWRGRSLPPLILQSLLAQDEGVSDEPGLDGVPRLYAFTKLCCLPGGNIYVRVGIPKALALAESSKAMVRNLTMFGAVLLLSLVVARGGASLFVLRPLNVLLSAIRRFDAGDLSARTDQPRIDGELGQVARAFDQMAATIQAREIERDRSEKALRLHAARTEALATIAARLNAQPELESVLSLVCQETARTLQVSAASVSLYDDRLDTLQIVTHYGLPENFGQQIQALEWSTCTRQLRCGEVTVVPDIQACPELPIASLFAALDIRSFVSTPMMHEGQLVGTLCIFMRGQVHDFTRGELAFLKAIADQAAQALANAHLYEALQQEQRARAALLDKTISAQEDERKRIARELHDQTSQDLAALMLSLDTCEVGLATDVSGLDRHLRTAKSIAETMLINIHRLINDLRPSLLDDLGLAPAIMWYGEQRLKPLGIALEFKCDRMEARLPPSLETTLFRITQEALTNVVRHAQATRVGMTLEVDDANVFLIVQDNGIGFQVAAVGSAQAMGRGLGLRGMRERATTLGGQLQIESAPGQGTTIKLNIPLPKEKDTGVQDPHIVS